MSKPKVMMEVQLLSSGCHCLLPVHPPESVYMQVGLLLLGVSFGFLNDLCSNCSLHVSHNKATFLFFFSVAQSKPGAKVERSSSSAGQWSDRSVT